MSCCTWHDWWCNFRLAFFAHCNICNIKLVQLAEWSRIKDPKPHIPTQFPCTRTAQRWVWGLVWPILSFQRKRQQWQKYYVWNKHVHLQNCLRHALWWFLSRSNTLFILFSEFDGRLCIKDVVGTNHSRFIRAFFPSGMVTCEPRISYQVWTLDFAQFNWHVPNKNRPACGGSEDFSILPHVRLEPNMRANINRFCHLSCGCVGHVFDEHDRITERRIKIRKYSKHQN